MLQCDNSIVGLCQRPQQLQSLRRAFTAIRHAECQYPTRAQRLLAIGMAQDNPVVLAQLQWLRQDQFCQLLALGTRLT
nr:hypothetical protein [Shewanella yunxiaonensis]